MTSEGLIECHEVKGFWHDDARAKIKIAADLYPFRFLAVMAQSKKAGGGWSWRCSSEPVLHGPFRLNRDGACLSPRPTRRAWAPMVGLYGQPAWAYFAYETGRWVWACW